MKNGKCLRLRHKKLLAEQGYKHKEFLVIKDTPEFMEFVHRKSGKILTIRY